jgi:hypothetical protein
MLARSESLGYRLDPASAGKSGRGGNFCTIRSVCGGTK